ncbi:MAG TPA: peptidase inhibitor family I36 protein [Nitrospira sp.]|nr:peptidase inhibitor family I36 protein [Nitrospira sp.]
MSFFKTGLAMIAAVACATAPVFAADLETQVIDKNCYVEVFDDDDFDMKDDHYKIQGPKEFASLKDVGGKNWNNDIESVIVGTNARVRAYSEKDFKGTELAFAPGQRVPNLGKLDMKDDIESMKISCGS